MANFSFPPPSFRGFNRQPYDTQFRRDFYDPRATYAPPGANGQPDFRDQTDDFSEDRSFNGGRELQRPFGSSERPSFPPPDAYAGGDRGFIPSQNAVESTRNPFFNPMSDRRFGKRGEEMRDEHRGKGKMYGKFRDDDDKMDKAERMKNKMIEKAKRKKERRAERRED